MSEISPASVQTIKGDVDWWRHQGVGVRPLQQLETGQELPIEHGHLSVQDQRGSRQRGDRSGELPKPAGAVDAVSAEEADRIAVLIGNDPPAIIGDFFGPVDFGRSPFLR
jgi:hypothetical protein